MGSALVQGFVGGSEGGWEEGGGQRHIKRLPLFRFLIFLKRQLSHKQNASEFSIKFIFQFLMIYVTYIHEKAYYTRKLTRINWSLKII